MKHHILLAALSLSTLACYVRPAPETVDEQGRTWVKLSESESLLPDIRRRAQAVGCQDVSGVTTQEGLELACRVDTVQIVQNERMLGFHCSRLERQACRKLVLSLTTDKRDMGQNATGGARWGI